MKSFLLSVCLMAVAISGSAQNCPVITTSSIVPVGTDSYMFNVTYTGSGNKHINVSFYCGTPIPANLISTSCIATNGSSFASLIFSCSGANPVAIVTPSTGNCGGGTSCAPFQVNVGGGPLPLRMTSFLIKRNNSSIALNWKTENEENVKEFRIERQVNNGWATVATIAASNKATGDNYGYIDNNNTKTTSLYRLKVIEMDGNYAYSAIRSVKGLGVTSDFIVFPNPSTGTAKINITDISENIDLQLIDQMGRVVKMIDMSNRNYVEINNLQKGMYVIRLINKSNGEAITRKLSVVY